VNARLEWVVRAEGPLPARDVYLHGVIAGVVAGIAMSGVLFLARLGGSAVQFEQILGTPFARPGIAAFVVGFGVHLALAGAVGALYARVLWRHLRWTDPFVGAAVGVGHGFLVALFLAVASPFEPIPWDWSIGPVALLEGFDARGFFWVLGAHAIFGALVGWQLEGPVGLASEG
jgi:hypothetical protein